MIVVNLLELGETMNNNSPYIFLKLFNTETGEINLIFEDEFDENDLGIEENEIEEFLNGKQDYLKRDFEIAYEFCNKNENEKYLSIERIEPGEIVDEMRKFAGNIQDEEKRYELQELIHGKGTIKRFNTFVYNEGYREEWLKIKDDFIKTRAREWLESNGIEFVEKEW